MTAQELGRFDESIEAIGTATKQAPGRANYWMSLAASYSHQRKVEPAVQAVGQAERLARTSQDWFAVGNSWYALGDGNHHMPAFQKAEAAYRHSLQLDGRVGRVRTNLGTAEEAQGKRAAALKDYQQGARLGDAEGTRHHARLTAAIAASQAAAQSARTTAPTTPYQCSQLSTADRLAWAATCTAIERRGY